jgi:hypothetical protein
METPIDFVKEQKDLYLPKTEPVIVDVPEMLFLMVDGKGQPESGPAEHDNEFQAAFGALYGIVYSIKFSDKKGSAPAGFKKFKVSPPEGLWWMEGGKGFDTSKPNDWRWTLMLRVPEFVTKDVIAKFADELEKKKGPGAYKKVRLEKYTEGPSVQIMHIGPYAEEQPNIEKMHAFAKEQGYKLHGHHHEIYFGDPRRSAPEKLKTVLRQPVRK